MEESNEETGEEGKKGITESLKNFYDKNYKKLMIIPFLIIILAIAQIGYQIYSTGDFINKGITLKGGTEVSIKSPDIIDTKGLENNLKNIFPGAELTVREITEAGTQTGIIVASDAQTKEQIDTLVDTLKEEVTITDYSIEQIGSSLAESFFKEVIKAVIIAFLFMSIVVFYFFRVPAPSLAVILAAASDIIVTVAAVNLMGIKVSTAGIAAFLMLIGYSVDTDMMLSAKVLKRKEGTVFERTISALKTGMMMTGTTMLAVTVALILARSDVIKQIMLILLIGLIVDLIMTWIQNVGILRLYLERKGKNE